MLLLQTSQGEKSWKGKLFDSPFHFLLIVSKHFTQKADNVALCLSPL